LAKPNEVNINPHGRKFTDNRGDPAGYNNRATPKNYGKNKCVGVIRGGKYVDPGTGEPIRTSTEKRDIRIPRYNLIGGVE
jgi:hypothetical protein